MPNTRVSSIHPKSDLVGKTAFRRLVEIEPDDHDLVHYREVYKCGVIVGVQEEPPSVTLHYGDDTCESVLLAEVLVAGVEFR